MTASMNKQNVWSIAICKSCGIQSNALDKSIITAPILFRSAIRFNKTWLEL